MQAALDAARDQLKAASAGAGAASTAKLSQAAGPLKGPRPKDRSLCCGRGGLDTALHCIVALSFRTVSPPARVACVSHD